MHRARQVIDGKGARIEPAWGKFVAAMKDESYSGGEPGEIFYHTVSSEG